MATKKNTAPKTAPAAVADPATVSLTAATPLRLNGIDIGEGEGFDASESDATALLAAGLATAVAAE